MPKNHATVPYIDHVMELGIKRAIQNAENRQRRIDSARTPMVAELKKPLVRRLRD